MSIYLEHHGILGQKWGKRNGPPYPLDESDKSARERAARKDTAEKLSEYFKSRPDVVDYKTWIKNEWNHPIKDLNDKIDLKMNMMNVDKLTRKWHSIPEQERDEILDIMPSDIRNNWDNILTEYNKGRTVTRIVAGIAIIGSTYNLTRGLIDLINY